MRYFNYFLLLFLVVSLQAVASPRLSNPVFQSLSTKNGLPQNSLFSQLGLGSSDEEIAEFFETHRGLNKSQHLHEAPYCNESQSAFLKDAIIEDAAWAEVIDQLNAELHE